MNYIYYYSTPIGTIGIEEKEQAISHLYLSEALPATDKIEKETLLLREAGLQLQDYFAGRRQVFDLPLAPEGSPFMQAVWRSLLDIPYGETRSYGEIAAAVGNKKASRAVGSANNRNPIGIIIPCHRVIGANGKLVGYGGGLKMKAFLLELEKHYAATCSMQ
ncbi:MAG TPA: methylated-DNA--[protein]-cysteine S-methyltransferase [Syntrophomonas sp.]|nr:methylated-DNA--[protein]-cysteine S-methyltransferase [Syntrophomonas sp.]